MKHLQHIIKFTFVTTLLLVITFSSYSQCSISGSISVSTSGFENGAGFSQEYILVNDATDEILVINTTGSFTGLASQDYRIYAVNYEGATPTELLVGDTWTDFVANSGSYCLSYIGPYDCPEILCIGDDLISTSSGYTLGGSFEEKYILVNSLGNITSTNTTGTFTGISIGDYTVYAVNTDNAGVKAEIDDLGAWSDILAYPPTACFDILGPKKIKYEDCAILPITLVKFDGELNNGSVDLFWQTENEINNDYFTIEKSKDGYQFSPIINKKGAGNSYNTINYSDTDPTPYKGISYYRLKQTDFDGNFSYSNTIEIANNKNDYKIRPNPSKDGYVYIDNLDNHELIKVVDALGRLLNIYKSINTKTITLNLSSYEKGLYYVVITNGDKVITEKIIIQ